MPRVRVWAVCVVVCVVCGVWCVGVVCAWCVWAESEDAVTPAAHVLHRLHCPDPAADTPPPLCAAPPTITTSTHTNTRTHAPHTDVIVTKAGPGTISEALICGLPMVLNAYVPCQEEGNIPYVTDNKVCA